MKRGQLLILLALLLIVIGIALHQQWNTLTNAVLLCLSCLGIQ